MENRDTGNFGNGFFEQLRPLPVRLAPHVPQSRKGKRLLSLEVTYIGTLRFPSLRHS